jgi:putative heme-binding domain-containing protein
MRLLEHPSGWWRDAAQRLLVARQDPAAVAPLRSLARASTSAVARAHALWTLEGAGELDERTIAAALGDPSGRVREQAVRLAEPRAARSAELAAALARRAGDDVPRVRLQVALSLGELPGLEAAESLARILRRDVKDPWIRAAVLSSSSHHAPQLLAWLFARDDRPPAEEPWWREVFTVLLETVLRQGDLAALQDILEREPTSLAPGRWDVLIAGALRASGKGLAAFPGAGRVLEHARAALLDPRLPADERIEAAQALGVDLPAAAAAAILGPGDPPELQLAVVRALGRDAQPSDTGLDALVAAIGATGPSVRAEILAALAATRSGQARLFAAIESEEIAPRDLDLGLREQLRSTLHPELRERAARLLDAAPSADRAAVVAAYRQALPGLTGSAAAGREVFHKHCSPCHQLDGEGFAVGPDLAETRVRGAEYLLESVLVPGRMVPPRYAPYTVTTRRGVTTGIIAAESDAAIRLLRAGGIEETVLRTDILELVPEGESLMPAGLETVISPGNMAHLLAFLAEAPADLASVTADAAATARERVLRTAHDGLDVVLRSQGRDPQASFAGRVDMPYVRQLDGKAVLAWRTRPAPATLPADGRHAFRLPAAMGYASQPAGGFELRLGGRRLAAFDVALASTVWRDAASGATLTYTVRARDAEDSTGELAIEVPASFLEPGKPATFEVLGGAAQSRRWFGLLPLR